MGICGIVKIMFLIFSRRSLIQTGAFALVLRVVIVADQRPDFGVRQLARVEHLFAREFSSWCSFHLSSLCLQMVVVETFISSF